MVNDVVVINRMGVNNKGEVPQEIHRVDNGAGTHESFAHHGVAMLEAGGMPPPIFYSCCWGLKKNLL
jgi:hypothetical protein